MVEFQEMKLTDGNLELISSRVVATEPGVFNERSRNKEAH